MTAPVVRTAKIGDETREAGFSENELYRYYLYIRWDSSLPLIQFIGLNPSTADENKDDPTLRRCKKFAKRWGFGGIVMTNIFAYRATNPEDMKMRKDPIGELNFYNLTSISRLCGWKIACWGKNGTWLKHDRVVSSKIKGMFCFGKNEDGTPVHPLYVPANRKLIKFN